MGKGAVGALLLVLSVLLSACAAEPLTAQPDPEPYLAAAPSQPANDPETEYLKTDHLERVTPMARHIAVPSENEAERWHAIPAPADDATALAEQLVAAERAVRDPSVTGRKLAFMSHLQQLVYMRLLNRPDVRDSVFAALAPDVRAAADYNLAAGANLWLFGPTAVTDLPEWRIVPAAPMEELLGYYHAAEAEFGVAWYYLAAINLVETRMGRIRGDSYAGAQGPMQFMPATWEAYGEGDVNEPRDAIRAAARYLRAMGGPEDMPRALWHYNHDNDYVDAVTKYAEVMRTDPNAFRGYYGWQVYFITTGGLFLLAEGWTKT